MINPDAAFPQKFNVVYSNSGHLSNKKRNVQSDGVLTISKNPPSVAGSNTTNTGFTLVLNDEFDKWVCRETVIDLKSLCSKNSEEIILKTFEIQIDSCIACAMTEAVLEKENCTGAKSSALNPAQKKFTGFIPPSLVRSKEKESSYCSNSAHFKPLASAAITYAPNPLSKLNSIASSSSSSSIGGDTIRANPNPLFKQSSSNPAGNSGSSDCGDIDSFLTRIMRPHQLEGVRFLLKVMGGVVTDTMRRKAIDGAAEAAAPAPDKKNVKKPARPIIDSDSSDSDDSLIVSSSSTSAKKVQPVSAGSKTIYTGAILGDEMGLGKTLQVISLIWTLLKRGKTNKAVIVAPSSLVENWQKEISKWLGVRMEPIVVKSGGSAGDTETKLKAFISGDTAKTRLLVISYDNLRKYCSKLNACKSWDVVVCDEGHRLKNSDGNQTIDALMKCRATQRVVLTGTPIQNDLDELFAIVSFVCPGYFSTISWFRSNISRNIMDSGGGRAGEEASRALKALLALIMIRRTQEEVLKKLLPPRTDYVVFCSLTPAQERQYGAMSKSVLGFEQQQPRPEVTCEGNLEEEREEDETFEQDGEAVEDDGPRGHLTLTGLQKLRRICIAALEEAPAPLAKDAKTVYGNKQSAAVAPSAEGVVSELYRRSSKYQLLDAMLSALRSEHPEEKAVVVASFTSTLDDIAALCDARGYGYLRIDGGVNTANRQGLVDCFNRPSDPRFLFLLGKRSGGQGLNLIGGSRLFMMEPDWNPSVDLQSMSRIWRENQKRICFIYRFVAAGKIEESIISRQLGKGKISDDLFEEGSGGGAAAKESDMVLSLLQSNDVESLIYPREGAGSVQSASGDDIAEEILEGVRGDSETAVLRVLIQKH